MSESSIRNKLNQLGLDARQAEIYLCLIKNGDMRIRDIVTVTSVPRSSVYEALKDLSTFGLIEEIVDQKHKIIRAYPLSAMKHGIEEKITSLNRKLGDIDSIEHSIARSHFDRSMPATKVRYYEGRSGARQLLWNTLKSSGPILVYSEWGRGRYVGIQFYKRFVLESSERGFKEKVLTNPTERVLNSIRDHQGTSVSRTDISAIHCLDPNEINVRGETFIYGDIFAQVFLKDDVISGFEIESPAFVVTQKMIFEKLWEQSQEISVLL